MLKNPWCDVPLEIYEAHMKQNEVAQLQVLNALMKSQLQDYPAARIAVLGVAGGNGLEHTLPTTEKIIGIDINPTYLKICSDRYEKSLRDRLELLQLDLREEKAVIPKVDLIAADLVIEYIGIEGFCKKACEAEPQILTCAIQENTQNNFVSKSPYKKALEGIGTLHQDIDAKQLMAELQKYSYRVIFSEYIELPQGKRLHRIDFEKISPMNGH